MLRSMTGYGRLEGKFGKLVFTIEMRSFNSRFLDLQIFTPREMSYVDEWLRTLIQRRVMRGKFTCAFTVAHAESAMFSSYSINEAAIAGLQEIAKKLNDQFGVRGELNVYNIISRPEIVTMQEDALDENAFRDAVVATANQVLDHLFEMQEKEGTFTHNLLKEKFNQLSDQLNTIRLAQVENTQNHFNSLKIRLSQLLSQQDLDENVFRQEVALLADRLDINEELDRIGSHFEQVKKYLDLDGEQVGKRLNFLLQELHREVNTIGSKCNSAFISQIAVEMKNNLEIIREQVQNIQ